MQLLFQRPWGRPRLLLPALATLVALMLSTSVAVASSDHPKYLAPPGNPAVSQYLEVVPNAMGSAPPRSGGNPPPSSGAASSSSLSPAEQKKLDHLGADGKTLARVVESTAPPQAGSTGGKTGSGSGDASSGSSTGESPSSSSDATTDPGQTNGTRSLSSTGSQSAVSAVLGAAAGQGGGGGTGILLPVLMGAGLLSLAVVVLRRRGARRP